ncbi:MAG: class I SAM-dependent methyltransferase [Deltaproteobacteria bacterium]|nr:class I SAM-dependent methyltransferase [Deltaproteobacteria bacterium]
MQEKLFQNAKNFYDGQFREKVYATGADQEIRRAEVKSQLEQIGWEEARVLEVGCGRGQLQDAAPGYIGCDISRESGRYLTKPFVCGVAEALPFADQSFDMVMSFTVLEHLVCPETALTEISRVLKKGGRLLLLAAWRVPPWRSLGLEVRNYEDLGVREKILKFCLPLFNLLWMKAIFRVPLRALRELRFHALKKIDCLPYTRMVPNWECFLLPDSDATASIDNHACALWLYARGFQSPAVKTSLRRILLPCGPLMMTKA